MIRGVFLSEAGGLSRAPAARPLAQEALCFTPEVCHNRRK
jgi:hypothetical protein